MTEHDTPEKADTPERGSWLLDDNTVKPLDLAPESLWRQANPGLMDPPTPAVLDMRRDRELAGKTTMELGRMGHSAAAICRLKGWEAGDVLETGQDVTAAILITAVGETYILAREIQPDAGAEIAWGLGYAEWEARG